ncbi:hypothetical protein JHK82_035956 [Glycine max]|nr:hypothetical protein JHK85_036688 [Glycine max]KAG4976670.1 hypothetical protein JHK86_036144 [Glycine max]KAG5112687.1 hypothetical protein JHK82_035956 [Glycine max]KAG5129966.1 hypothetical protein JHK84_036363 [Glycine max]
MASAVSKVSGDLKSSSFDRVREAPPPPPDSSLLLATRPPRHLSLSLSASQAVSYWTCSKLCAFCFVAGAVFGYSLRGRVKRWASKMLKKLS